MFKKNLINTLILVSFSMISEQCLAECSCWKGMPLNSYCFAGCDIAEVENSKCLAWCIEYNQGVNCSSSTSKELFTECKSRYPEKIQPYSCVNEFTE